MAQLQCRVKRDTVDKYASITGSVLALATGILDPSRYAALDIWIRLNLDPGLTPPPTRKLLSQIFPGRIPSTVPLFFPLTWWDVDPIVSPRKVGNASGFWVPPVSAALLPNSSFINAERGNS